MFKMSESSKNKLSDYADSILQYIMSNELNSLDVYDYDDFAQELDVAIQNGEVEEIPELDREDAFKLAIQMKDDAGDDNFDDSMDGDHDDTMKSIGWGSDEDYGDYGQQDDMFESTMKDTEQIISMLNESLASKKAKKLGLVHVGFGNYAPESGAPAKYKTVNGKLRKVSGGKAPAKKAIATEKGEEKKKEEPKKDKKEKSTGIKNLRRVGGEKFTYEFEKDGRKYKFTLNKSERKQMKGEGSITSIVKNRLKKKAEKQQSKLFKKGEHADKVTK